MNIRSAALSLVVATIVSAAAVPTPAQVYYIDADINTGTGNTVLDGAGSFGPTTTTTVANDGMWSIRTWPVNGAGVLATNQKEDATPRLATTYTLPLAGTYNIYGYFWNNQSGDGVWDVSFQLGSGSATTYSKGNATNLAATSGHFTTGVVVDDGSGQNLFEAPLGTWDTATYGNTVTVFIDDPETASGDDRTWYDGIGFKASTPGTSINYVAGDLITLNDNGGWCWYQDERAIVDTAANKIVLSSVANSSGADGASRGGDIDVVEYDLTTQQTDRFVLGSFEDDDHNVAAIHKRSDGRYVAAYARHSRDSNTRFRVSTNPGDATSWDAETTCNNGAGTTYNNLYYLPNDDGGNGRLYNFTRSINFDPTIQISDDEGLTWEGTYKLLTEGDAGDRPYVRYASDGESIHFITTERHPRDSGVNNSIYHGYVQDGQLFTSDGTLLDANLFDGTAVTPSALTTVFAANTVDQGEPMTRAWTVDIEVDSSGNPYAVFQARIDPGELSAGTESLDHRFFYGRFDGLAWNVHALAEAGRDIYAASPNGPEDDYTGLVALDPDNPDVLYISSDIDPRANQATAYYEIYKGVTDDFGLSWHWTAITENSTMDNIRPVVPKWDAANTALLWQRGTFTTFLDYDMDVVGIIMVPEPASIVLLIAGLLGLTCLRRRK